MRPIEKNALLLDGAMIDKLLLLAMPFTLAAAATAVLP